MSLHPISVTGHRLVGQLTPSHNLRFHTNENGLAVALQLLSSAYSGAPVVDSDGKMVGFISEFDILAALEADRELNQLQAEELMVRDRKAVHPSTTIMEAVRMMKEHHLLVLPIEQDGKVVGSLTRHDLLRAWIAGGLGIESK